MTSFTRYGSEVRDNQDGTERGVVGVTENVTDAAGNAAGRIMSVRGTGTVDLELPIFNFGYGFTLPTDSDAEVLMLSLGNDVNDKVAVPQLARTAQRQWPENTGGVQHPTDPARYVEFNAEETHLSDGTFVIGAAREVTITVDGTNVTISTAGNATVTASGDMTLAAGGAMALTSNGVLTHNGADISNTHTHPGDSGGNTGVPN